MSTTIQYQGQQVKVDRMEDETFCIHLPGRQLKIQYQPDNEGADHWIDLESNHETEEAVALGEELGKLLP